MMFFGAVLALGWLICVIAGFHHGGVTHADATEADGQVVAYGPSTISDWLLVGVAIELVGLAGWCAVLAL